MKRLQVMIENKTHARIVEIVKACNDGFEDGIVRPQDVVEWMLANSSFDQTKIRQKRISPKKVTGNANIETKEDVDELIKKLNQLKGSLKSRGGK